ncbi:RNA methyltransferase [Pseudomonas sp. NBRC 100443]|uniref:RNA methyltransferase n=1 Tax=Pseudomonas sp. NBRC 100443 TaxID=1113665 RepID=UPI0024A5CAA2|nr:RNA methyltransferase [Pseudomonas sp. NBRC 100443]GLU37130.1 23S rRNA methyltransferase [Pseudomonas sp. NBRC 100443]
MRGFACIGLHMPKDHLNIGEVLRAAGCYEAAMVAISGKRYQRARTDTRAQHRHMPVIHSVDDLKTVIPFGCVPVAVDLIPDATPLPDYSHPESAFYIFGPEDGTLGDQVLTWCKDRVYVPTRHCMNLAATVNVVLYDRLSKRKEARHG